MIKKLHVKTGDTVIVVSGNSKGTVGKVIDPELHVRPLEHTPYHLGIAADRYTLITCVKIVVVKGEPYRQAFYYKGGQLAAGPSPLFFGVALYQLLVNVGSDERDRLLLKVFRLSDPGGTALALDLLICLLGSHDAPHPVEGVHIEG